MRGMLDDTYFYEPKVGHGLPHDPFNAMVAPRPIGWISSRSLAGCLNLAPYSFFNAFNYRPPIVGFSSVGYKDSLRNVEATHEFTWNLTTRPLAKAMNITSATVAPDVDEFELSGLTPAASRVISTPRVEESPVAFECLLSDLVQLRGASGDKVNSWLVLGEVVGVHIARRYLHEGIYQTSDAEPVMRGGGPVNYFSIQDSNLFQMKRPK